MINLSGLKRMVCFVCRTYLKSIMKCLHVYIIYQIDDIQYQNLTQFGSELLLANQLVNLFYEEILKTLSVMSAKLIILHIFI